jgi:hypothetical protein
MVSEIEGEKEQDSSQDFVPVLKPRRQIEEVRSWDANRVITRPKVGDEEWRPDYFDNTEGITAQEQENEDDNASNDSFSENFGSGNVTLSNDTSNLSKVNAKFGHAGFKAPEDASSSVETPEAPSQLMEVINEENVSVKS